MTPTYQYIPSTEYISSLTFDHIETYSLQRGPTYERSIQELQEEYAHLKKQNEQPAQWKPADEQRYKVLGGLPRRTQYLLDENGPLHFSAIKTHTFKAGDPEIAQVTRILQTPTLNVPQWLCAPVYRDAIVFYDIQGTIISTLNICLSCQYMELQAFIHINADETAYHLFQRFFKDLGHDVENE